MRPIRLEMEGFTAFREKCEIDFSAFDLFAITGQTGAGKTSILDAITYALYGKTSRLNKAGKDLITQGAKAMSVVLHFRTGADEYKVRRDIRGSSVTVRLEQLREGEWVGISPSEINGRILQIVGLDFDGFTKAVILPQGQFDLFLRGKPDERRKVLNELLDVRVYQAMMQSANEKSKIAGERARIKEVEIDALATAEAKLELDQHLTALKVSEQSLADVVGRLQTALPEALTLREKRASLKKGREQLAAIKIEINEAEAARSVAETAAEREKALLEALDREIESVAYDSDRHLTLTELEQRALQRKQTDDRLHEYIRKVDLGRESLAEVEMTVGRVRETFSKAVASRREVEIVRASSKASYLELESGYGSVQSVRDLVAEINSAQSESAKISEIDQAIRDLEARSGQLDLQLEAATTDVRDAETKQEDARAHYDHLHARHAAAALRRDLKPGEACPVCEQTVRSVPEVPEPEELRLVEEALGRAKAVVEEKDAKVNLIQKERDLIPTRIESARKERGFRQAAVYSALEKACRVLGRETDSNSTADLEALIEKLETTKAAYDNAQSRFEQSAQEERKAELSLREAEHRRELVLQHIEGFTNQIELINAELADLNNALQNAPPLDAMQTELEALKAAKTKCEELDQRRIRAQSQLNEARATVLSCAKDHEALANRASDLQRSNDEFGQDIHRLEEHLSITLGDISLEGTGDEAARIEQRHINARSELDSIRECLQQCRFAIQSLDEKIQKNERLRNEIAGEKREEAVYKDLGVWLNAGNFQQYLLSAAFELLAAEGSKYFKSLSADRYVFQYEGKEFGVIDRWNGEARSVDTLSGGESFLASLALALALAQSIKDLNSSAGSATLESLFLDEGFSTLDAETLSKVADALQLLQDGNRLIGVITHIQSLADQMPARIEIEKTISGSRLRTMSADQAGIV
jgi:DNA repair protein SbcC/Rad50